MCLRPPQSAPQPVPGTAGLDAQDANSLKRNYVIQAGDGRKYQQFFLLIDPDSCLCAVPCERLLSYREICEEESGDSYQAPVCAPKSL